MLAAASRELPAPGGQSMTTKSLDGAHALITGGGTGIGRGIAASLLRQGAVVTIAARRLPVLEETAQQLSADFPGAQVRVAVCDVTESDQVEAAVAIATDADGRLDIAVANAGSAVPGPFLLLDDKAWRFCCDLNIIGTASTFRYAALAMREHGGSLVAISTAASSAPEVSMSAYTATKAAVDMMVRAAAWELGVYGIRVNSILPGFVPTDSTQGSFTPELERDLLARSALKRSGTPRDIGELIVHLSQPNGWITGQVIGVDGGMTVQPMADLSDISRRIYGAAAVDEALGLHRGAAL
jgi:NAD(P)-dependent dehydrogenase (short-subunit alcohol dehydrogenase family)